jgi:hypothetical protein
MISMEIGGELSRHIVLLNDGATGECSVTFILEGPLAGDREALNVRFRG